MPGAEKTVHAVLYVYSVGAATHVSDPIEVEIGDQQPLIRVVDPMMAALGKALGQLRQRERKSLVDARHKKTTSNT